MLILGCDNYGVICFVIKMVFVFSLHGVLSFTMY